MKDLNIENLTYDEVVRYVSKGVIVQPSKIPEDEKKFILKFGAYYKFSSNFGNPIYVIKYKNKNYYLNHIDVEYGILKILIMEYGAFYKSPYSMSYYSNPNKRWGGDIEGGIRISNHWNFKDQYTDYIHCETWEYVKDGNYNVGIFKNGKYHIIDGVNQFINRGLVKGGN